MLQRATKYTPAVTMVAAWINALTGVGPAMASGSQIYRGIWADLAVHPSKKRMHIRVIRPGDRREALAKTSEYFNDQIPCFPRPVIKRSIPMAKKKSPTLFVIKAFFPATALALSLNQNAIRRYEHRPTPSQPKNISRKLSASTRFIMLNIKRLR